MSSNSHPERRESPRYERVVRAQLWHGQRRFSAITTDIGPTGVFVVSQVFPSAGDTVTLELDHPWLPNEPVRLLARVARVVRRGNAKGAIPGSALRFIRASTEGSADHLNRLLRRVIGREVVAHATPGGGAFYEFDESDEVPDWLTDATSDPGLDAALARPLRWRRGPRTGQGRLLRLSGDEAIVEIDRSADDDWLDFGARLEARLESMEPSAAGETKHFQVVMRTSTTATGIVVACRVVEPPSPTRAAPMRVASVSAP